MSEVKLLPLPEEKPDDPLRADAAFNEGWNACRDSMLAHATAPLQAEIEALRAEVAELRKRDAEWNRTAGEAVARAERLAEALRDARRALAFAAQHLPECNEPYERANAALQAQEDRNG